MNKSKVMDLMNEENNRKLNIQEYIPNDINTDFAIAFGRALLEGCFDGLQQYLDSSSTLIVYEFQTIEGKEKIINYWKGWRERYVLTNKVNEFEVAYSNYNSHACLLIEHMVVLFSISDGHVTDMLLTTKKLNSRIGFYDDLMNFPFSVEGIKDILTPSEDNGVNNIGKKANRIPCFKCGKKSEDLVWYDFKTEVDSVGYIGEASICPACQKVVEFYPESKYKIGPEKELEEYIPF